MSEITLIKNIDIDGKDRVYESFVFNPADQSMQDKPGVASSALYLMGEWICEYLSCSPDNCWDYLCSSGFAQSKLKDYLSPHTLFNHYLETTNQLAHAFLKLVSENTLTIPSVTYRRSDNEFQETYICDNITEFCTVLINNLFRNQKRVKRCEHCGNWFVPYTKADELYCARPSPQYPEKNCKAAARYLKELERRKREEVRLLRNLRQMRYNSGEETDDINEKNREWMRQLQSGKITYDKYIVNLRSLYKKKYR